MLSLRRAAARSLQSQTFIHSRPARSFTSITTSVSRATPSSIWQTSVKHQSRFYSEGKPSPAEEQGEETVTEEPSRSEQRRDIREESIADSETADARGSFGAAGQRVRNAANRAYDAVAPGPTTSPFDGSQQPTHPDNASKILYVGNLYFDLTPNKLKQKFEEFGDVVNCKIVTDASGMSKGFGYIEYSSVEEATEAVTNLQQVELEGRRMAVQYHMRRSRNPRGDGPRPTSQRNPPSRTLFIGNMSFQMSDKDLNDLFRTCKGVLDVRVAIDRRSGQPRGFAHADFDTEQSATAGKALLENKVVYGRQLRVDYSLPSSRTRARPADE